SPFTVDGRRGPKRADTARKRPGTSADNASMASTGMYSNFIGSAGAIGNRPRPVNSVPTSRRCDRAVDFDSVTSLWYRRRRAMSSAIPHEALTRAATLALGDAARITAVEPLHGDASTRRYLRLRLAGARVPTGVAVLPRGGRFAPASHEPGGAAAGDVPS